MKKGDATLVAAVTTRLVEVAVEDGEGRRDQAARQPGEREEDSLLPVGRHRELPRAACQGGRNGQGRLGRNAACSARDACSDRKASRAFTCDLPWCF